MLETIKSYSEILKKSQGGGKSMNTTLVQVVEFVLYEMQERSRVLGSGVVGSPLGTQI